MKECIIRCINRNQKSEKVVLYSDVVDVFVGKRILVRRIINRQFRIMATLATEEFVCKKDIYIIKLNDNNLSYEYVLGILNSKLISYYKTKASGSAKKDDFTQITLTDIRMLPIPLVDLNVQKMPEEE